MMLSLSATVSGLASLLIVRVQPALGATADATCYYPSGSEAPGYTACGNPSSDAQSCCHNSEPCLSNGLCFAPSLGIVYRGACTDRTWADNACPNIFTEGHENSSVNMYHCYNRALFQVDNNSCDDPGTYSYKGASVIPYQGAPALLSSNPSSSSSSTASATSTSTSTSATPLSTSASAATDQCPNCPSSETNISSSDSCSSTKKTIGLGVGLGLGLPLLAVAGIFCALWMSERRKRVQAEQRPAAWEGGQGPRVEPMSKPVIHELNSDARPANRPGELEGGSER